MDVRVERKSGNKLRVILNENLMNEGVRMLIGVGNEFKHENIEVLLAPTQKYQIESVVYEWDKFEMHEGTLREMYTQTFQNNSASPISFGVFPYLKSTRNIVFDDPTVNWEEGIFSNLLGTPLPQITISDIANGKPVLLDTKVHFGIRQQHLVVDLDKELIVDISIDAFEKRKVTVYNVMKSYSVPYEVYLSNPRTGKKLTFSGILNSEDPIDYFIFNRVADEN